MKTADLEDCLTPTEVAELLNIQPQTLRVWRSRGKGPRFFKLGAGAKHNIFYPRKEFDAFLRENGRILSSTAKGKS